MAQLTKEIVDAAIEGLEARKQRIDEQIAELRAIVTVGASRRSSLDEAAPTQETKRKGGISVAGRKAIAEAQRRRWAAKKAGTKTSTDSAPKKAKRRLSAAGRKAIAEAQKKRWAVKKAATKH